MYQTNCSEEEARKASAVLDNLGQFKGSLPHFTKPVQEYLIEKLIDVLKFASEGGNNERRNKERDH